MHRGRVSVELAGALGILGIGAAVLAGCRWSPFSNIGAGEGPAPSAPSPLAWEGGVFRHDDTRPADLNPDPPWAPLGPPVTGMLAAPWTPITREIAKDRCYAVEMRIGTGGVSPQGPLSAAARSAGVQPVIRGPDRAILARRDAGTNSLSFCNSDGLPAVTLDVTAGTDTYAGVLGEGGYSVQFYERAPNREEKWQMEARRTPFLTGGRIVLHDPEGAYSKTGLTVKRDLASFTPVPLGDLGPARCFAATVTASPDAKINPEARTADAPFEFSVQAGFKAQKVEDGALVTTDVCNGSADGIPVSLTFALRSGAPSPGTGAVTIELYQRPLFALAARTPWLGAGVLSPPPETRYVPVGAPEVRQIEAFEPVAVSIPAGECRAFEAKPIGSASIDPKATMDSHLWVWIDRSTPPAAKKNRPLAQWEEKGRMVARPYCNESAGPWPMEIALISRDGKPAGKGPVQIQVMTKDKRNP